MIFLLLLIISFLIKLLGSEGLILASNNFNLYYFKIFRGNVIPLNPSNILYIFYGSLPSTSSNKSKGIN